MITMSSIPSNEPDPEPEPIIDIEPEPLPDPQWIDHPEVEWGISQNDRVKPYNLVINESGVEISSYQVITPYQTTSADIKIPDRKQKPPKDADDDDTVEE